MDLYANSWICMYSETFWNILLAFWNILDAFWNILDAFWNILDVVEGCRKVDFQVDHGWTDTQTLGLVELRLRS